MICSAQEGSKRSTWRSWTASGQFLGHFLRLQMPNRLALSSSLDLGKQCFFSPMPPPPPALTAKHSRRKGREGRREGASSGAPSRVLEVLSSMRHSHRHLPKAACQYGSARHSWQEPWLVLELKTPTPTLSRLFLRRIDKSQD